MNMIRSMSCIRVRRDSNGCYISKLTAPRQENFVLRKSYFKKILCQENLGIRFAETELELQYGNEDYNGAANRKLYGQGRR